MVTAPPNDEMNNQMMGDRRTPVTLAACDRTARELVTLPTIRAVRSIRDRVRERRAARA
jgi:hypothetical protein